MNTNQQPDDFPEIQRAIYGIALSLDAFLLNGIPYGVLLRDVLPGFLEKTADNVLRDLANLEEQARHTPAADQAKVTEILSELRSNSQQLIDHVAGLLPFRTLSLERLRSMVSQVPLLREMCVHQIQQLEACFQTPRLFYESRPADSTASVNNYLAALESIFTQEWSAPASK